jgi:hypothetical protein
MSQKKNHDAYYPIIINDKCHVGSNKYRYEFPRGSVSFKNSSIALNSIDIFYSWYNITTAFNNQIFTLGFPTALGTVWYQVVIPEGFYSVATLNAWFQNWMVLNDLYLINGSGNYVYYAEFVTNPSYYAIQLNLYEVPTALPVGWSKPVAFTFPAVATRPDIVVGSNGFGTLIGFSAGVYSSASQISDLTPQMAPVQSVILQCSALDNKYALPSTNLYSFSAGTSAFGAMITSSATELVYVDLMDASVSYLEISLVDQNFNPLAFRDPNMVIQLIIKVRE